MHANFPQLIGFKICMKSNAILLEAFKASKKKKTIKFTILKYCNQRALLIVRRVTKTNDKNISMWNS